MTPPSDSSDTSVNTMTLPSDTSVPIVETMTGDVATVAPSQEIYDFVATVSTVDDFVNTDAFWEQLYAGPTGISIPEILPESIMENLNSCHIYDIIVDTLNPRSDNSVAILDIWTPSIDETYPHGDGVSTVDDCVHTVSFWEQLYDWPTWYRNLHARDLVRVNYGKAALLIPIVSCLQ